MTSEFFTVGQFVVERRISPTDEHDSSTSGAKVVADELQFEGQIIRSTVFDAESLDGIMRSQEAIRVAALDSRIIGGVHCDVWVLPVLQIGHMYVSHILVSTDGWLPHTFPRVLRAALHLRTAEDDVAPLKVHIGASENLVQCFLVTNVEVGLPTVAI